MPSPGMRGWYVELDEELVREFERLFPEQGMKTLLTSRAVILAIRHRSIQPLEGDYVQRHTGDERRLHPGTEGTMPYGSWTRE